MPRSAQMISYAQNFEDLMLDRLFQDESAGFYVDVGAADPVVCSVTKHFYDTGWRGINIEPTAQFHRLAEARPRDVNLRLAVSNTQGRMAFVEFPDEPSRSGLAGTLMAPEDRAPLKRALTREVEVRTLRDIFEEHCPGPIAFMSVDVEGHEREVLEGNDWSRFRPRALVIEATLPNTTTPCHQKFEPVLVAAGYLFVYFDGLNRFYVREEDRHLARHFELPPNIFDDYKLASAAGEQVVKHYEEELARVDAHARRMEEMCRAANETLARQAQVIAALSAEIGRLSAEIGRLHNGTGERSLKLGLWVARCVSRLGRLPRRLRHKAS
jgi:FkbM family methyltransferase